MTIDTVQAVGDRILSRGLTAPSCTVIWHAGEPLVVTPSWYEIAFDALESHCPRGVKLSHAIQTNGVLINDDWINFFKQRNIKLGVSLDGPAFLHDRSRFTRRGGGTHASVMCGISRLQRAGFPFHIIAVLTRMSLEYAAEILDFFISNGLYNIAFNIDEIENVNMSSTLASGNVDARFSKFIDYLIMRTAELDGQLNIRELDKLTQQLLRPQHIDAINSQNNPWEITSIDWKGGVSTFSPELLGASHERFDSFTFGNIHDEELSAIEKTPEFKRVANEIAKGVSACERSCGYFQICGGGAPSNKLFENGSFASTETLFCRLMIKRLADRVLTHFEAALSIDSSLELPPGG